MSNASVHARRRSTQGPSKPAPGPRPTPRPAPPRPSEREPVQVRQAPITSIHHPDRFIRNVVADFRRWLSGFRYSSSCATDAVLHFQAHRTIRGCESIEAVDWPMVGGWLVQNLEPLLPAPVDVDELNRENDIAYHARAGIFHPSPADQLAAVLMFVDHDQADQVQPRQTARRPAPRPAATHFGQPWTDADQAAHHGCC